MKGAIVVYVLIRALEVDCCSTAKNGAVETLATGCLSAQWFCSRGPPGNSHRTVLLTAARRWNRDDHALEMVPTGRRCPVWLGEPETATVGVLWISRERFSCVQRAQIEIAG